MPDFILDVQGLETTFKTPDGIVYAVNGVAFGRAEAETSGAVGDSGCGKSVTKVSLPGMIPSPLGQVKAGIAIFENQDRYLYVRWFARRAPASDARHALRGMTQSFPGDCARPGSL